MPLHTSFANEPEASRDDVSTDADERVWADRIRAGDRDAFEALYRAYWQRLYAFAFRYVRSKEDAEEVVQDVFFRIWRGREDWVPAGALRNYLYLAVRNVARDRLERAAVARRWRLGQIPTPQEIQSNLEEADLVALVERALAELPAKRSAVCKLRLIDGLSYAQIADRLRISQKTVETQLARGLKSVRDRVRPGTNAGLPPGAYVGLAPAVRTSAPPDGSARNMCRSTSSAAPRGA